MSHNNKHGEREICWHSKKINARVILLDFIWNVTKITPKLRFRPIKIVACIVTIRFSMWFSTSIAWVTWKKLALFGIKQLFFSLFCVEILDFRNTQLVTYSEFSAEDKKKTVKIERCRRRRWSFFAGCRNVNCGQWSIGLD